MKKIILFSVLPILLCLTSCERTSNNHVTENIDSTVTTNTTTNNNDTIVVMHDRVQREKTEYRMRTQRDIDSTQDYIDRMDKKMENAGAKAKADWQQTKARMQPKLDRAKADLNEFENKADDAWDEFRDKVKANLDSLRADWKRTDVDIDVKVKQK
jgi:hypothetical protein